jgi:hypothetical protein
MVSTGREWLHRVEGGRSSRRAREWLHRVKSCRSRFWPACDPHGLNPIIRETNSSYLKAVTYSNTNRVETTDLPAAVSGGLVCDLPDPVDPEQIVEVDPPAGLVGVKAELDRGSVSHLSHRDESTHNARTGRRRPLLKAVGDQIFIPILLAQVR